MASFTCPHCDHPLECGVELAGQLVACPNCDGQIQLPPRPLPVVPLVVSPSPSGHRHRTPKPELNPWPIIVTVLALSLTAGPVIFMFVCCGGCIYSAKDTGPSTAEDVRTPHAGDSATVSCGAGETLVAANAAAYDRLHRLANARDNAGTAEMVMLGQVFAVRDGTPVLVIGTSGMFSMEIRIKDGPHSGKSGIVPFEFVRPVEKKS